MKKGNVILVLIVAILAGILIYYLPSIYKWNEERKGAIKIKNQVSEVKGEKEKKATTDEINSDILKEIVYPTIRSNNNSMDSYFSISPFTVDKLNNNDILAFAFKNIYDGYIEDYTASGCTTIGKKVDATYIDARIKNIISKNINYKHDDFIVYDTPYPGLWKYDTTQNIYIYNGDCNISSIKYYDLQSIKEYKVKDNNKTLEIIVSVAFAKVENNKYTIYSDSKLTKVLSSGNFTDVNELNKLVSKLNTNSYKYIYKQGLCSYDAYCLETGEWING